MLRDKVRLVERTIGRIVGFSFFLLLFSPFSLPC